MKKSVCKAIIIKNEKISSDIFDMILKTPEISSEAQSGQFIEMYTGKGENLLPRPISICEIDKNNSTLRVVYQVVGTGTKHFSNLKKDDVIKVMGPIGNGFKLYEEDTHILVGGGIGVPPLLETAKQLKGNKIAFLGFRNSSNSILEQDFKKYCNEVYISTDDGSKGFKGNIVELIKSKEIKKGIFYSCGPKIMLKALSEYTIENNLKCQISMEERMACGIGACVGCVIKIKDGNDWSYKKVCKDGPVFDACEVIWNE